MNNALIEQRDALQTQLETLKVQAEIASLETQLRCYGHESRLIEGWGDTIDFMEPMSIERDFLGSPQVHRLRADDRRDGDNYPFFRSELELFTIQGAGEWVATADSTAAGALDTLTGYVIHTGFDWKANAKEGAPQEAADFIKRCIDGFLKRESWQGGLDRELFKRQCRHGERFLWVKAASNGVPYSELIEPTWITEPTNPRAVEQYYGLPELSWKYGIATTPNRPWEVHGYFVCYYGDTKDWVFVPAREMSHVKINVDRNVKRGLSDYYAGGEWVSAAAKLLNRIVEGGTVQASIALIREWETQTKNSKISNAADGVVEFQSRLNPREGGSGRSIPTERFYPGKVVDVKGAKYHPGPMGNSNALNFIEIVGAANRKAANRWGMPEFMYTGDASNANYASTLVSESPFVRGCEARQQIVATADKGILWRVVWLECQRGYSPYSFQELQRMVDIEAECPDIVAINKKENHEIRKEQHEAGILSLDSWAAAEGIKYEDEKAKIALEPKPLPDMGFGLNPNMPGQQEQVPDLASRVFEDYQRQQAAYVDYLEGTATLDRPTKGKWRTINGNRVLIGDDGTVLKGPKALMGRDLDKSDAGKKPHDLSDFEGDIGGWDSDEVSAFLPDNFDSLDEDEKSEAIWRAVDEVRNKTIEDWCDANGYTESELYDAQPSDANIIGTPSEVNDWLSTASDKVDRLRDETKARDIDKAAIDSGVKSLEEIAGSMGLEVENVYRSRSSLSTYVTLKSGDDLIEVRFSDHEQVPGGGMNIGTGERHGESDLSLVTNKGSAFKEKELRTALQSILDEMASLTESLKERNKNRRNRFSHKIARRLNVNV